MLLHAGSNFLPHEFLGLSRRILQQIKNAVYHLLLFALVLHRFKFAKFVKHPNEKTDDVIHSTQHFVKNINKNVKVQSLS